MTAGKVVMALSSSLTEEKIKSERFLISSQLPHLPKRWTKKPLMPLKPWRKLSQRNLRKELKKRPRESLLRLLMMTLSPLLKRREEEWIEIRSHNGPKTTTTIGTIRTRRPVVGAGNQSNSKIKQHRLREWWQARSSINLKWLDNWDATLETNLLTLVMTCSSWKNSQNKSLTDFHC